MKKFRQFCLKEFSFLFEFAYIIDERIEIKKDFWNARKNCYLYILDNILNEKT